MCLLHSADYIPVSHLTAIAGHVVSKRWGEECPIAGCKGQKGARGDVGRIGIQVCKVT